MVQGAPTIWINVISAINSQVYNFLVDKNMQVLAFKESIARVVNVPAGRQRLIFNGHFLDDYHFLSEYHLENGHTMHLAARQPAPSQGSTDTSSLNLNAQHYLGRLHAAAHNNNLTYLDILRAIDHLESRMDEVTTEISFINEEMSMLEQQVRRNEEWLANHDPRNNSFL